MRRKSFKRRFFAILGCIVVLIGTIIPFSIPVSASPDPDTYEISWYEGVNIFSGEIQFCSTSMLQPGIFEITKSNAVDGSIYMLGLGTISSLVEAAGISVDDVVPALTFTGFPSLYIRDDDGRNIAFCEAEGSVGYIEVSCDVNTFLSYTLCVRTSFTDKKIIMEYPTIMIGNAIDVPAVIMDGTREYSGGFSKWPVCQNFNYVSGYENFHFTSLSDAQNLITYSWLSESLKTATNFSDSVTTYDSTLFMPSYGVFHVSFNYNDNTSLRLQFGSVYSLLTSAGVDVSTITEPVLSISGGIRMFVMGGSLPVMVTTHTSCLSYVEFDSVEAMLNSTFDIVFSLDENAVHEMHFPLIALGRVVRTTSAGTPTTLSSSTWRPFSDLSDVPTELTYNDGYEAGYDAGYNAGVSAGEESGYQNGYNAGVSAGEESGYQNGYNAGVSAGEESGYQTGYDEGYQAGLGAGGGSDSGSSSTPLLLNPMFTWQSVLMYVNYTAENGNYAVSDTIYYTDLSTMPLINANGTFDFSYFADYLLSTVAPASDNLGADVVRTPYKYGVLISWKTPLVTNSYSYNVQYSVDEHYGHVQFFNGFMSAADSTYFHDENLSPTKIGAQNFLYTVNSNVATNRIRFLIDFPVDASACVESFTFKIVSTDVTLAYSNGLNDGMNQAKDAVAELKDEIFKEGQASGYQSGFSAGKKEGLQIAETGDWKQLMLAVTEAPINAFQSLFNFEILGLDMRAAFGSMLTLCVLLIVFKKVIT